MGADMVGYSQGKNLIHRQRLMSWWRLWEHGYRGPMPYVVGPGWRPPGGAAIGREAHAVIYDEWRSR